MERFHTLHHFIDPAQTGPPRTSESALSENPLGLNENTAI